MYHTKNRLNDITFDNEKPLKIIQTLDVSNAHGYDAISARIPKLTNTSIIKPLSIFQNCLKSTIFQMIGKKQLLCWFIENSKQLANSFCPCVTVTYKFKSFGEAHIPWYF